MGVVHRDIKPENILFAEPSEDSPIKLIDFEMSNWIKDGLDFVDAVGTPYYVAPEVLGGRYNKECDVWSCGAWWLSQDDCDIRLNGKAKIECQWALPGQPMDLEVM